MSQRHGKAWKWRCEKKIQRKGAVSEGVAAFHARHTFDGEQKVPSRLCKSCRYDVFGRSKNWTAFL